MRNFLRRKPRQLVKNARYTSTLEKYSILEFFLIEDDIGVGRGGYVGDVNDLLQVIEDSCETSNSSLEYISLNDNKLFLTYQSFVEEDEQYEQVFKIEINDANDFVQDLIEHL